MSSPYAVIKNAGTINLPDEHSGSIIPTPLGDAQPDSEGNFIFEPFNGGGRMDKEALVDEFRRYKNIQAARFGEVNTFYHINKIASYIDELLNELGERPLPRLKVVVNAHPAIYTQNGKRDGCRGLKSGKCLPFQGGHYRSSSRNLPDTPEFHPISPDGEIHLGPGWRLTEFGALPEFAKCKYRCNASHNAGIIYHEYGHHVTRHTADFMANRFRAPHRQSNQKSDLDEAISDYWAATMLDCPHIWTWHRKHTRNEIHPRSLASIKTMTAFDSGSNADPHLNGTIYGAALWDMRNEFCEMYSDGSRKMDLIVLKSLILMGQLQDSEFNPTTTGARKCRSGFGTGRASLAEADKICYDGRHSEIITKCFSQRGIDSKNLKRSIPCRDLNAGHIPTINVPDRNIEKSVIHILKRDEHAIIPKTNEILSRQELETKLGTNKTGPFSLTVVGDIMLGSRMNKLLHKFGPEYPFYSVYPILRRSSIVLGNLEGPLAKITKKQERNYSYRVNPKNARILRRAGFNVVTMANNHILDCGRQGVLETFSALKKHGIRYIGAGENEENAHVPAILQAGKYKIGLLGYYWNRRTSARGSKPGSAIDTQEHVANDIHDLRPYVDRVVVTVHWGVPYERYPSEEDREKAHFAVDCGADIVIGHHPHVVQPFEMYKNRPIFYSIGNFAFGSGNSKAESIMLAIIFQETYTELTIFPAYIKNRDHRINYQPRIITGNAAFESINRLKKISGTSADFIYFENDTGKIISSQCQGEVK
ncbi:CapA family protein [bacterium]|nr:CapA family protein [bacterium]